MGQPVLLCYHIEGEKFKKLRLAAMRFKIRVRPVRPEEYGQTLAALCAMEPPSDRPAPTRTFEEEMLVMADFPPGVTMPFLQSFRRLGIPPIALKAVLTPTNSAWDSLRLHDELSSERAALAQGSRPAHETPSSTDA